MNPTCNRIWSTESRSGNSGPIERTCVLPRKIRSRKQLATFAGVHPTAGTGDERQGRTKTPVQSLGDCERIPGEITPHFYGRLRR